MSLTALLWAILFCTFTVLTLRRASWGILVYMMTFFALPTQRWWGAGVLSSIGARWSLLAACILCVGVILDSRPRSEAATRFARPVLWLLILYALNATAVHFLAASHPETSWEGLVMLWKQLGLLLLLVHALRDEFDLRLFLLGIAGGAIYLGFEVIVHGAGGSHQGRLVKLGIQGVGTADLLAALLCMVMPLMGYLVFRPNPLDRVAGALAGGLSMEIVLRCVSRGAFLSLCVALAWMVAQTRGQARRYVLIGTLLAATAVLTTSSGEFLNSIYERFATTFAAEQERDQAAAGRIRFWIQGLKFVSDYPFGNGSEAAFESDRGFAYIIPIGWDRYRAVHNGYIDVAASWGVQGFALYCLAILIAWRQLRRGISAAHARGDPRTAFQGSCIETALITQLVASMFLSNFRGEWFFWWMAMAISYGSLQLDAEAASQTEEFAESEAGEQPAAEEFDPEEFESEEPESEALASRDKASIVKDRLCPS